MRRISSRLPGVLNNWQGRLTSLERYVLTRTLRAVAGALAVIAAVVMLIDFVEISRDIGGRVDMSAAGLIGLMLMKSPAVIEKAYYDYKGVNTLYHKNALIRMNREMGANFDPQQFEYWPIYDAVTGTCRRYLVSQTEQVVKFSRQGFQIAFNSWETISVGLSQKYDNEMIHDLLEMSGMDMERSLGDHRQLCTLLMLRSIRM